MSMDNILEGLNKEQKQAVEQIYGTILILAGAGSGKTKVLTTRIANLVLNGVNPYSILAVTFTNKAAKEMKERLSKILGEDIVKRMWVGTFHSVCGRILRSDIDKYSPEGKESSWDKNFVIYDETDSMTIIKNAIKKLELDDKVYQPKLIKTIISNAKNKMQNAFSFQSRARDYKSEKVGEIFEEYEKQLILNNAIDFDDMLLLGVKLLETNSSVCEKYFQRFSHILVDEFQDTNPSQYSLIKLLYTNNLPENQLEERSLCTVGDVDQSIYSWRGADFKIILNFQHDFKNTKLIKLEQNYRSVETILEAANYVILNNSERIDKNLYSNMGKGEKIIHYETPNESYEAMTVASKICEMKDQGKNYSDFAVLYRTNSQSRPIEEALISKGLPYKMVGGLKFYDRKEIKDIVAYLKLIYNQNDSQSLKRIINTPKRGIGATTIKKLQDLSEKNYVSIFEILNNLDETNEFNSSTKLKLKDFLDKINDMITFSKKCSNLNELIAFVIESSGYLKELKEEDTVESQGRIENLQELINVSSEFEALEEENILGEFLSQVALVSDLDSVSNENLDDAITLMTLHSAKGLEFDTVFLTGLEEGIFPHSRSLNSKAEMEEERRLMYVGITRAKQRLFLLNAKSRQIWGEYRFYTPSRFLTEIAPQLIESKTLQKKTQSFNQDHTFKSAVDKIKSSNGFGSNFVAPKNQKSNTTFVTKKFVDSSYSSFSTSSYSKSNSFGKNFIAPVSKTTFLNNDLSQLKEEKKRSDEEKIKKMLANSKMKKLLEEKKSLERQQIEKNFKDKPSATKFKLGERVFHPQFGVGKIEDVESLSSDGLEEVYIVNFGKFGLKSVDASYSNLKKF